jgi:hypothetical protein
MTTPEMIELADTMLVKLARAVAMLDEIKREMAADQTVVAAFKNELESRPPVRRRRLKSAMP